MNYENFVFKLDIDQIDNVIADIDLLEKGYKFHYAIDTFDIINYCLPYTDNLFSNPSNRNFFAQRIIAYSYFFKNCIDNTYICHQYQKELKQIGEKIMKDQHKLLTELSKNTQSILDVFNNESKKSDLEYNIAIKNNLELLTTLLILDTEYRSETSVRIDFLKEKFKSFKLEKKIYNGDDEILDLLQDSQENRLVPIVFTSFVEEIAYYLNSLTNRTSRYHYLNTTYLDIEVVCKVGDVVKKLESKGSKMMLYYLSSTPLKSQQIFTILKRISGEGIGLPDVGGKPNFNFQRDIFQVFLTHKLTERFGNDLEVVKKVLLLIRKIKIQISTYPFSVSKNQRQFELNFFQHLSDYEKKDFATINHLLKVISTNIENHFYYDKFIELFNQQQHTNSKEVALLQRALGIVKSEEENLLHVRNLIDSLSQFTSTQTLLSWFNYADNNRVQINIHSGLDIVKNIYHHLPLLIFLGRVEDDEVTTSIYKAMNLIATPKYIPGNEDEIVGLFKKVISLINVDSEKLNEQLTGTIIISWINLISVDKEAIAASANNPGTYPINEEYILLFLERFSHLYQNTSFSARYNTTSTRTILSLHPEKINEDIGYLLLWLLRRNLRFQDGYVLGKSLITLYNQDPRMFHGLGLCYISEFYYLKKGKSSDLTETDRLNMMQLIQEALRHLEKALELYNFRLVSRIDDHLKDLIGKAKAAIYNSLIDIHLNLYKMQPQNRNPQRLGACRELLGLMKETYSKFNLRYEMHDIPNFTEAELEYHEAAYFFLNNEVQKASLKILHSTNRAYQIYEKTNIDEFFQETLTDINNLRIQIFKVLRII